MELILKNLKKTYGNVKALKGINYTFTSEIKMGEKFYFVMIIQIRLRLLISLS